MDETSEYRGSTWALAVGMVFMSLMILIPYRIASMSPNNVWVALLITAGILLPLAGTAIYAASESLGVYLALGGLNLVIMGITMWLSQMSAGWWWSGAWLIVALFHFITAIDAWQENDDHMWVALGLGILATVAAVLCPLLLYPILQNTEIAMLAQLPWMWALLALALIVLGFAWHQGYVELEGKPFAILGVVGAGLLAGATWISNWRGGWELAVAWLLAAALLGHAARRLFSYYESGAGWLGSVLAALCISISVWSALQTANAPVQPVTQVQTVVTPTLTPQAAAPAPIPTSVESPTSVSLALDEFLRNGTNAVQNFLGTAILSVWGIFHLLILVALGHLWIGSGWRSLAPFAILIMAIWFFGGMKSDIVNLLSYFFSSSPDVWMRDMLLFSINRWGTMGWGILLTAVLVSMLMVPALRISTKVNRVLMFNSMLRIRSGFAVQRIIVDDMRSLGVHPLDSVLATAVTVIMPFGLWIALWISLRNMAAMEKEFWGFAGIPDLTVPHWSPVWEFPYFALSALLWLSLEVFVRIQKRLDPDSQQDTGLSSTIVLFIGSAIAGSLVPAGVTVFSIGMVLAQSVLFPLRVAGIPKTEELVWRKLWDILLDPDRKEAERQRREEVERQRREEVERQRREEAERQRREEAERQRREEVERQRREEVERQRREEKERHRELLWSSSQPLASMIVLGDQHWFLTKTGDLFVQTEMIKKVALPVTRGQSMFALQDTTSDEPCVLVVGDDREILWVGRHSCNVLRKMKISQPAQAFEINPFKTMLAWMNTSTGTVGGLFFETEREVVFASESSAVPALAFSNGGNYLAFGTSEGKICIIHLAARKILETLNPPDNSAIKGKPVIFLFSRKDGGWISIHKNKRIVCWDANHRFEKEKFIQRSIHSADLCVETGNLAFGLSEGFLRVFDKDLNLVFDEKIHEKEITWVGFSQDGRWIFTIGGKTAVKKVELR